MPTTNRKESLFKVTRGWPLGYAMETVEYWHLDAKKVGNLGGIAANGLALSENVTKGVFVYRDPTEGLVKPVTTTLLDGATFTGPVGVLVEGLSLNEGFSGDFTDKGAILWGNYICEFPILEGKAHADGVAFPWVINAPVTIVGGVIAPIDADFTYTDLSSNLNPIDTSGYQGFGWVVSFDSTSQIVKVQFPGGKVT